MKGFLSALFAFALSAATARADVCPATTADQAAAEVHAAFDAWNEAVMHKDLDGTMRIFSQSIHFQFQGAADFGYARLLKIYTSTFSRENAPQWHPVVENTIASPEMVTLFSEWKLIPAGGGDPISEYRGVDVFQREADCAWRVMASLNYADKPVVAASPDTTPHTISPATAETNDKVPQVAWRETRVRDLDSGSGHD